MPVLYYPAIVEGGDSPGYSVFFPDLPGCVSAGDTLDDAARAAEEALALHVRGMIEDATALPPATSMDRIPADPEVEEIARILVRVEVPGKAVRFNATMDEALLAQIDRAAQATGMSRSGFLAEAARRMLG